MATERMCIHNSAIFCSEDRCSVKCGWNPRGAKARQNAIRTKGLARRDNGIRYLPVKSRGCGDAN